MNLKDLIPNQAKLARDVGVSVQTVRTWIELGTIPPKRVIAVANALDIELSALMQFAGKTYKPNKIKPKTLEDLALIVRGEHDANDRSAAKILEVWGDRVPLPYQTLCQLQDKTIDVAQAAERLGCTKSAVHNTRSRYGIAPGVLRAPGKKVEGRYKLGAKEARKLSIDVIAGRKTAVAAAKGAKISLRTLHRHIEAVLRPQYLNEISHWSKNFRLALASEIEKNSERHTVLWRKWAEDRGLILQKTTKWPKTPKNWREVPIRRIIIAYLSGEASLDELAMLRGGEAHILREHVERELRQMGMPALSLTIHHQAAVAEILIAMDSHFRRPNVRRE